MGREGELYPQAISTFRARFKGQVLSPSDPDYEAARPVWNAMIDKRPGLIARPTGTDDVRTAVGLARENDIDLAIRGGGHGVGGFGTCDGGIVLDFSSMKGLSIDAERRVARAEPGVLWGEFDTEAQKLGLATTGGFVPTTGIAGLTLGGGLGYLMRRFGLACDNVLSAQVVTADGDVLAVSPNENEDLFWGLRGGGGNFGVVTSLEYRLHEVGPIILGGALAFPPPQAVEALRFYREAAMSAPEELTLHCAFMPAPDGNPVFAFLLCYSGSVEEGEKVVKPLRDFGPPVADMVQPMPYVALQEMGGMLYPPGRLNYWKSSFIAELSDDAIGTMVEQFERVPSPLSAVALEHMGGAVSRVGEDETAFGDRDVDFSLIITAEWEDPAESGENVQWTRDVWEAMRPFSKDSHYINYLGHGEEDRIKSSYGPKFERLTQLKTKYDPDNVFHINQNIKPTAATG